MIIIANVLNNYVLSTTENFLNLFLIESLQQLRSLKHKDYFPVPLLNRKKIPNCSLKIILLKM